MNCFLLKHRWACGTDSHPEQSSLKMLYFYYIIEVNLKNNNNPINLIKMSTDAWSYFLAMNYKAACAVLMSPLNAEVVHQVPPCASCRISPRNLYFQFHLLGYLVVSFNTTLRSLAQNPFLHKNRRRVMLFCVECKYFILKGCSLKLCSVQFTSYLWQIFPPICGKYSLG